MSALVDKLLARSGKTREQISKNSKLGRAFRRTGVRKTSNFERIKYLPRRDWREGASDLAVLLKEAYGRPASDFCTEECVCRGVGDMWLRDLQAAALGNFHDFGGLFGAISVGKGKTLVSFLAPAVVGSERPLLLVPANLRDKTSFDWWQLAVHWKLPKVRVESYERLGVVQNAKLLDNYAPDLIICDEAHRLRNTRAAVTRRVARYLKNNPTRMMLMSGTLTTKSLRDYWHLLRWAVGPEQMPLPNTWDEMMEWADALDVKTGNMIRTAPGALVELCNTEEQEAVELGGEAELEAIRSAFKRRLTESPGVVSTFGKHIGNSLVISSADLPLDHMHSYFSQLRAKWQTPDGWDFTEAIEMWRHAREFVSGFYNVWDPRPPDEWMEKRRNWKRWVRETLAHSHTLDTELEVENACSSGSLDSYTVVERRDKSGLLRSVEVDVYEEWAEIRHTFKPNAVPVWIDDTALKFAANWLKKNEGIVWTEYPAFGRKLEEMSGYPYFGRGGLDQSGTMIEKTSAKRVIASVRSNHMGRNLQFQWHKNLVVSCVPNAKIIEQMLGRTHRDGQDKDEVYFEFVLACREQLAGFHAAVRQARYIEQTLGQPQRLLYADTTNVMSLDEAAKLSGPRW